GDSRRGQNRAAAVAALRDRGVRLRRAVRGRRRPPRPDRHLSRAARDDPIEAGARVPVGQLRTHSRLQASAARRCAASDWGPGGPAAVTRQGWKAGRSEGWKAEGPELGRTERPGGAKAAWRTSRTARSKRSAITRIRKLRKLRSRRRRRHAIPT